MTWYNTELLHTIMPLIGAIRKKKTKKHLPLSVNQKCYLLISLCRFQVFLSPIIYPLHSSPVPLLCKGTIRVCGTFLKTQEMLQHFKVRFLVEHWQDYKRFLTFCHFIQVYYYLRWSVHDLNARGIMWHNYTDMRTHTHILTQWQTGRYTY